MSRRTLDALIRAKLATLQDCPKVEALPVAWKARQDGQGCNWIIPGWVGEAVAVRSCVGKVEHYLQFLRDQFDIPAENGAGD